jgi:2-haloacid dehalogenase
MARFAIPEQTRLITFDCYGTLVDWETGIRSALAALAEEAGVAWTSGTFDRYLQIEAQIQAGAFVSYRSVLDEVEHQLRTEWGSQSTSQQLSRSVKNWPVFSDTPDALRRLATAHPLGILSNIDDDLFSQTALQLGARFDCVVTAQQVGQYKPAHAHFETVMRQRNLAPSELLHVAQSQYHDIQPCLNLGIPCVWINRRSESPIERTAPVAIFPNMGDLAEEAIASS